MEKIEVIITNHCKYSPLTIQLREEIGLYTALKYLWLWFDKCMICQEHFKKMAVKASQKVAALYGIMGNLGV